MRIPRTPGSFAALIAAGLSVAGLSLSGCVSSTDIDALHDQIADVLTYVRREWGHTGSPIEAATVIGTRTETTGRTRPWTTEELTKLMGGL